MAVTQDREGDREVTSEALLAHLDRLVARDRRELAREFATAMLRRVPTFQLETSDPETLAEELADAFRFFDDRRGGDLAVRAVNPEHTTERWQTPGTVIEVNAVDRPFLLSTLKEELDSRGLEVVRLFHPVIGVERDEDGRLTRITAARHAERRESIVVAELTARLDDDERAALEGGLRQVLEDVLAATRDEPEMRATVEQLAASLRGHLATGVADEEVGEVAALLDWLLDGNFLLLGTRDYELVDVGGEPAVRADAGSGRGVLAEDETSTYAEPRPLSDADEGMRSRYRSEAVLTIARSHRLSTVHRRARMLNVWVRRTDDEGRTIGETRLIGLFTRKAYAEPSSTVPVLRRRIGRFLEDEDIIEDSHDERVFVSLFEAVPMEELFELDDAALRQLLLGLFAAEESHEPRLLVRTNEITGTVSALLSVPRDRYDADLRRRISALLQERFGGTAVDVDLSLSDRPDAVVRFAVHVPEGPIPDVDLDALQDEVAAQCRSWEDHLRAALVQRLGTSETHRLIRDIATGMPATYRSHAPLEVAIEDILAIDELQRSNAELLIRIHPGPGTDRPLTRVKILRRGGGIELSAILPVLESLGLTVSEELPFRIRGDAPRIHLHDYGVHHDGAIVDVDADGPRLAAAIRAVWQGDLEVDSLNRLILTAGLDWEWVGLFRAYRRFRRQVGTAYTAEYQNDALVEHPTTARALAALFAARFDPDRPAGDDVIAEHRQAVLDSLDDVSRLDHDRILRMFLSLVDATLRTNRYAAEPGRPLALKFDSAAVPRTPRPVPHREIFVSSPHVEGIHLRGGPVARGGIRWSDRRDDFRSEVLGLMQAQMLKNAVIVPTGAKGGFVLKRQPSDPAELRAEVERRYRDYIHALLDVTDTVEHGEVRRPPRVAAHDGEDPYLVVAADRGTATFSDTANAIAEEHGFWLGDAFASGGSRGYDHKALGITARGAWVAVQRHFRELGIDVQTEPIRVVGIGDMSGDVFGNGMLRSRVIQLVAAFDHRDIFLDPDPDPERSYAERKRLFEDPALTWQDYDRDVISRGGGVWSRDAKRVPISEEVAALLRIDAQELAPPDLVRAILAAPVDLLFAGGIGTFIKASDESNDDIGDRANDEIRIDATQVRARVIGEGANLAITQPARIQYARRGGRVNADFIDNSAGVDISDHEVNLKILLGLAIEEGELDLDDRDRLLAQLTEEVEAACLRDVHDQTWVLTQESASSPQHIDAYASLVTHLESIGVLERDVESLPTNEELEARREAGAGLTRPELAVLLAAAKRELHDVLVESDVPDQPAMRQALEDYFPPTIVERFGHLLDRHRLRRELVATVLANAVVNRMGTTFVNRLARELGSDRATVAAAWWLAREIADADRYWGAIQHVEREVDTSLAVAIEADVDGLLEVLTREYVRSGDLADLEHLVGRDREAFVQLEQVVSARTPSRDDERAARLVDAGLDVGIVSCLLAIGDLSIAPDVASVARAVGRSVDEVADAFLTLRDALGLRRLRALLDGYEPDGRWARWQHRGLVDDLRALHRVAAHRALAEAPDEEGATAVERFLSRRRDALTHAQRLVREIVDEPEDLRLDAVSVATRAIRDALRSSTRRP